MRHRSLLLVLLPAAVLLGGAVPFPPESPIVRELELFPASPAVNDQRGFAIAMDGEWLAVGARLEEVDGRDNAGAVYLFRFEDATGTWREKQRLRSETPQKGGQFGFAMALRGNTLSVSAIGEQRVEVFTEADGVWTWQKNLEGPGEIGFGRSVSVDGSSIAVGAGDPHGRSAGAVYVFSGASWADSTRLSGDPEDPEERFGHAVSLSGSALAVGAPGADDAKGAVHLFDLVNGAWQPAVPLSDPNLAEGNQFGFAVAMDGLDVVVGAPTAGNDNSGAAWVYSRSGGGLSRLLGIGGQRGYAVAIDGDRIAVGIPGRLEKGIGTLQVFTRTAGAWSGLVYYSADNWGLFGFSGFSIAVSGKWVMHGSALSDYGGNAAGSVSSLRCSGQACESRGDIVVGGEVAGERFGTSVAADGDLFAVGGYDEELARASATVFRRASKGWWQEARLPLPSDRPDDLAAPIAVHQGPVEGHLLVVGSPSNSGSVLLFRKVGENWNVERTLVPPSSNHGDKFGRSVSTDGRTVVVGAAKDGGGNSRGAAYVFEYKGNGEWTPGIPLLLPMPENVEDPAPPLVGDAFGFAVAVQGDTIVVGAPFAKGRDGEVHVFHREGGVWVWKRALGGANLDEFGSAVAIDGDTIVVGAPRHFDGGPYAGAVYVFAGSGLLQQVLPGEIEIDPRGQNQGFGSAVALRGDRLVVGAPVIGSLTVDIDKAFLFEREGDGPWKWTAAVDAIRRIPRPGGGESSPIGDHFGTGVALGHGFFVVTNPGKQGGDRVSVFELKAEKKEQP